MKIEYWCCIGFGPKTSEVFDTEDFGYDDEGWSELTQEQKEEGLEDWAMERISYGIKELQ